VGGGHRPTERLADFGKGQLIAIPQQNYLPLVRRQQSDRSFDPFLLFDTGQQ